MNNAERWKIYTQHLSSPNNYIEWGFRYLIAACLQRRVWLGPSDGKLPDSQACFANMYPILVGPPAVGKGLIIKEVNYFLKHWKLKDAIPLDLENMSKDGRETAQAVMADNLDKANSSELQQSNKQSGVIEPLLIPVAADTITYESLVEAVANSYRRINFEIVNEETGEKKPGIYGHSSMCFCLPELGSLMRKKTDDLVNFLLGLYDCPNDHEYSTKNQGKDRIRRGCLNLLAGTTPGFLEKIFSDDLIDEGFSSRIFAIYANKNRKNQFFIPQLTEEQKQCRQEILIHTRKLASLYGSIRIDDETRQFLHEWWDTFNKNMSKRTNLSSKLIPYYGRKNIHVMKVAMAEHFADNLELHIPLDTFKKAIEILDEEEKNMHMAIVMESRNPVSNIARKILDYLKVGKKSGVEIMIDLFSAGSKTEIEDAISFLEMTKQVTVKQETDKDLDTTIVYYELPL